MSQAWLAVFRDQIEQRNKSERAGFEQLIKAYETIAKESSSQSYELNNNRKRILELEDTVRLLTQENQGLKSSPENAAQSQVLSQLAQAKIKELEEKLLSLHEELALAYKQKADQAHMVLDAQNANTALKAEIKKKSIENEELDALAKHLKLNLEELNTTIKQKEAAIEFLNNEIKAIRVSYLSSSMFITRVL